MRQDGERAPTGIRPPAPPRSGGLFACGVGLPVPSLIPARTRERGAAAALRRAAEPLTTGLSDAAKHLAEGLKEPAQVAMENVKATASDATEHVKTEGQGAVGDGPHCSALGSGWTWPGGHPARRRYQRCGDLCGELHAVSCG